MFLQQHYDASSPEVVDHILAQHIPIMSRSVIVFSKHSFNLRDLPFTTVNSNKLCITFPKTVDRIFCFFLTK